MDLTSMLSFLTAPAPFSFLTSICSVYVFNSQCVSQLPSFAFSELNVFRYPSDEIIYVYICLSWLTPGLALQRAKSFPTGSLLLAGKWHLHSYYVGLQSLIIKASIFSVFKGHPDRCGALFGSIRNIIEFVLVNSAMFFSLNDVLLNKTIYFDPHQVYEVATRKVQHPRLHMSQLFYPGVPRKSMETIASNTRKKSSEIDSFVSLYIQ